MSGDLSELHGVELDLVESNDTSPFSCCSWSCQMLLGHCRRSGAPSSRQLPADMPCGTSFMTCGTPSEDCDLALEATNIDVPFLPSSGLGEPLQMLVHGSRVFESPDSAEIVAFMSEPGARFSRSAREVSRSSTGTLAVAAPKSPDRWFCVTKSGHSQHSSSVSIRDPAQQRLTMVILSLVILAIGLYPFTADRSNIRFDL